MRDRRSLRTLVMAVMFFAGYALPLAPALGAPSDGPDLAVAAVAGSGWSHEGQGIYQVAVTNLGTVAASPVGLSHNLPGFVEVLSASGSGWECQFAGHGVDCTAAEIASGATLSVEVTVLVAANNASQAVIDVAVSAAGDTDNQNDRTQLRVDLGTGGAPPAVDPPEDQPPAGELPTGDIPPSEPPVDVPPADQPPADAPPTNEPPADQPPGDTPLPGDTPPADTPPADTPPAEAPPADAPPIPDPADGVPPTELPAGDQPGTPPPPASEPPPDQPTVPVSTDPPAQPAPVDSPADGERVQGNDVQVAGSEPGSVAEPALPSAPPPVEPPGHEPPVAEPPAGPPNGVPVGPPSVTPPAINLPQQPLPPNQPPTGHAGTFTAPAAGNTVIDLATLAVDPEGDSLTITITTEPSHGQLVIDENGLATYLPSPGYAGTDLFLLEACDPAGACLEFQVEVRVRPVNDLVLAFGNSFGLALPSQTVATDSAIALVADMLSLAGGRLLLPLGALGTVITGSLLVGMESLGSRLHDLVKLLLGRN